MAKKKRHLELWLGLLVIVSSIITLLGFFWLTGQPLGEPRYHIFMKLTDASGLERGDRVQVSGVEAGGVRSVRLIAPDEVVVRLWVMKDVHLPSDSRAVLQSVGVFGDQFVLLHPGVASTLLNDGDTIAAGKASGLTDLVGDLGTDAQIVLQKVDRLLADSSISDVHAALSGIRTTVVEFGKLAQENSTDLRTLSSSLAQTAQKLERDLDGVNLGGTIDSLEVSAARIAETAEAFRTSAESLRSIADKIDRGEGTFARLLNDSSLYVELTRTTRIVGSLMEDMQQNPGRYIKVSVF